MHTLIIGIALGLNVAAFAVPVAAASTTYVATVRTNCQTLQTTLNELQRRDLVARINRGRAYQDLLDQTQALTTRLRSNSLDPGSFEAAYAKFNNRVNEFRNNYLRYDDLMSNLVQVNCIEKPEDFVALLAQVRDARTAVGDTVTNIEGDLANYRQLTTALQARLSELQATPTGGAQ